MTAITKADLVTHLFNVLGTNKRESKEVVDLFFDEIIAALARGEIIKLSGFGIFSPKNKTSREGRNPRTNEVVMITKRRVVTFKAAAVLKAKIQTYVESSKKISEKN